MSVSNHKTRKKELANNAKLRSAVYGLFATVFRKEPSEAFISKLVDSKLSNVLSSVGIELGDNFYNNPVSETVDALEIEFARLFIGPGHHISAHESIFANKDGETSSLWGAKTVEVKNFIETTGLDYKPEFNDIPDHISVELEFMQKLSEWESVQWNNNNKNAKQCLVIQKQFIGEHLLQWAPELCDKIIKNTNLAFYGEMSKAVKEFLIFDQKSIEESLSYNLV